MKISYRFVTGEVVEVEVGDDVGKVVLELRKAESSLNRKERRVKNRIMEKMNETGEMCCVDCHECESDDNFKKAYERLTETQKRRIELVADGYSLSEISLMEGVGKASVNESVREGRKKFKNNF